MPPLNVFRMLAGMPKVESCSCSSAAPCSRAPSTPLAEMAVLRVAHATDAAYEWRSTSRSPATGVTEDEIAAIRDEDLVTSLDEECNLICRVADEVSRDVRLSDDAPSPSSSTATAPATRPG